ncbi:MAG TPA: ABC transporter permease, partial [Burkholderiales bacterium]|nr:ABC transporter permease [Burkholderiales bacterium]
MLRLLAVLAAHRPRARWVLSVAGIALGVALGYGVHLVNRAAVEEVAAAVRAVAGEADLEVRGGRAGFPESLYPALARLPGVELASPALELDVGLAGGGRTLRITGIDILRAAQLQPRLVPQERQALLAPDRVFLSAAAADALALGQGDRLRLAVGQKIVELEVAGVLPASSLRGMAALSDVATAQWRFGRLGELNRIDIRLRATTSLQEGMEEIRALLPPGVYVSPVRTLEEASAYPSRSYRVNLDVLAMVALFTGGFLVFSAQALEIARRRGEHALLRVLGLERGGVLRLVLLEAALLGALGSLLGLALGVLLAQAALRASGGDLGAGVFHGAPRLDIALVPAVLYFLAGTAAAVIGALLPARDAAAAPAARALRAGDEQAMFDRAAPLALPVLLLAAGAILAGLPAVRGLPLPGYASIACLLVGSVALMPRLSRALFRLLPLPSSPGLALALAQLRAAPGQAAVSLAAIVASFALMAAMAIMVASFRQSVDDWLGTVLPADLYFRTSQEGDTGYLEPGFEARVRALPQVARADFLRSGRVLLDPKRPAVALIVRDRAARAFPLVDAGAPDRAPGVWVSEATQDLYGFRTGDTIRLPLQGREAAFRVRGVYRDYARQHGSILIDRAEYIALTGDRRVNDAAIWLAPAATRAAAMAAVRALPGGETLEMSDPGEIRRMSLRVFDRSFAVTYAM